MLVIDGLHLLDAALIFFGRQGIRMHPRLDDFHGDSPADDLAAEAEDVAVIVLAGQLCAEWVLADNGIDAVELVRDHYNGPAVKTTLKNF